MHNTLKILLILLVIVTGTAVVSTYLLSRAGINPLLWLSMPASSQFSEDARDGTISISLQEILTGFEQITDFQFFPGSNTVFFVLQKTGELYQVDLNRSPKKTLLFSIPVLTASEQGLLGIAIHPNFPELPCIYLNYVIRFEKKDTSQISEWCFEKTHEDVLWFENRILFRLEQPYKNHNAGHLIFDKQNNLYIPWGDGGSANDPHGHGQNLQSYLGKILRVYPTPPDEEMAYIVPEDNPFMQDDEIPDEIYAYGLRNPWKLAFDDQQRLIAADVGQDAWEEITFIEAGGNHGWNNIEALHCFKENCSAENTVLPFIEYGHDQGRSVTGGYQYTSSEIPALTRKYIYADFVTGRIWAADLPDKNIATEINTRDAAKTYTQVYSLGQWPLLISTFARDYSGNIYLADFARGSIYKIAPLDVLNETAD